MKLNKLTKLILNTCLAGVFLTACNSGVSSTNPSSPSPVTPITNGPVDTKMFVKEILKQYPQNQNNKSLNGAALTEIGNVANLDPYAALAFASLKVVGGLFSTPAVTTNQIYDEEQNISNQISNLQTQLTNDQNIMLIWYNQEIAAKTANAAYNFQENINDVNSNYNEFMLMTLDSNSSTGALNLSDVTSNNVNQFYKNINFSSNTSAKNLLGSISSSECSLNPPNTNWSNINTSSFELNGAMATNLDGGTLSSLLSAMQASLLTNLSTPGTPGQANMIPLISQYNQAVELVYMQTISALQQAYIMEASQNYFQYAYPKINPGELAIQDCVLSNYESTSSGVSYDDSQAYLVQLFADRMNIAYQTALKYMISDNVVTPTAAQTPFLAEINSPLQAKNLTTSVGSVVGGGWQNQSILYQESTIINYKSCAEAFKNNLPLNDTSCPSLMPNKNGGYYDGESISAYYLSYPGTSTNYELSPYPAFNFSQGCVVESGLSIWTKSNISPATSFGFVCNQWSLVNQYSINYNSDNSSLNYQDSNGVIPQYGWIPSNNNFVKNEGYFNVTVNDHQDYHIYVNSGSLVPSFTLVNGFGHFEQSDSNTLYNGGTSSTNKLNTAGMQVALPNGFNLPFYIFALGGAEIQTSLQLVCPAGNTQAGENAFQNMFSPYLLSCSVSGSSNDAAIMTVTTSDNSTYILELNGGGGKSAQQNAYLAVYQ